MIITLEVLHSLKSKKVVDNWSMVLKLDMSKAFDRIEWDYIKNLMLKMDFQSIFVNLIMSCITTVFYSMIVNGGIYGQIIRELGCVKKILYLLISFCFVVKV